MNWIRGLFTRSSGQRVHQPQRDVYVPALGRDVTPEERFRLISWLQNPDTKLALSVAMAFRPSIFEAPTYRMNEALDAQRAQNFLAVLQGWDKCLASVLSVGTPVKVRKQITENFNQPE